MPKLTFKRVELKERYPCVCVGCQETIHVAPSMMMSEFGKNTGSGTCPKCQAYLHLEINADNASITSELFEEFVKRETSEVN